MCLSVFACLVLSLSCVSLSGDGCDHHVAVSSRAGPYGEQLSSAAEGEDAQSAERLCSASAVFLALYDQDQGQDQDQPATEADAGDERPDPDGSGGGGICCRLGDLLRQVCVIRILPSCRIPSM